MPRLPDDRSDPGLINAAVEEYAGGKDAPPLEQADAVIRILVGLMEWAGTHHVHFNHLLTEARRRYERKD